MINTYSLIWTVVFLAAGRRHQEWQTETFMPTTRAESANYVTRCCRHFEKNHFRWSRTHVIGRIAPSVLRNESPAHLIQRPLWRLAVVIATVTVVADCYVRWIVDEFYPTTCDTMAWPLLVSYCSTRQFRVIDPGTLEVLQSTGPVFANFCRQTARFVETQLC